MKKNGKSYHPFDYYRPTIRKFEIEDKLLHNVKKELIVEEVLKNNTFSRDELLIAKLVLAEQAYLSAFETLGDQLVESVEKTENKGKDVNFYLRLLQMNKKLFMEKAKDKNKYVLVKLKKV